MISLQVAQRVCPGDADHFPHREQMPSAFHACGRVMGLGGMGRPVIPGSHPSPHVRPSAAALIAGLRPA